MTLASISAQPLATTTLTRALAEDRVASSYLFEGPGGTGKSRAALGLAMGDNCPEKPGVGCGTCTICKRIGEGKHPDVRIFAPREEGHGNIPVEFLREEILPFAHYAPFEGKAAYLIFPQADISFPELHPGAANALLKTLEEPRPRVHFVLLSERPDRLLSTIRSRCQKVLFRPLPAEVLDGILAEAGVAERERAVAITLANGRADVAIELAKEGKIEDTLNLVFDIDHATLEGRPGSLVSAAEDIARDDRLTLILQTLATYYRDVAVAHETGTAEGILLRTEAGRILDRTQTLDASAATARFQRIREVTATFERNANKQTALDALFFELPSLR